VAALSHPILDDCLTMPTLYDDVFIAGTGFHLPGPPIDNDGMDVFIAPINRVSGRIKQRILAENGIKTRHYAIDADGRTRESNAQMAASAIRAALADAKCDLAQIDLLACGTSGGDSIMPGFANMVQGELAAPPMHTHTSVGVCASSLGALAFAAGQVQQRDAQRALAVGSDLPSRMFKSTRFAPRGYDADFNAHFLRWMLSDGAGALVLAHRDVLPDDAPRLRLNWVHQKSFSGDHPVCMQLGLNLEATKSYLDYESSSAAEADGALALRQDIRLLPHLFDIAIHEYAALVQRGLVDPQRVDHFLCHYSSERFRPVVDELMHAAKLAIPQERWWTNLHARGNTGAASLFVMLSEFVRTRELKEGEQIFCFVPESGRFTVAYALFEVERPRTATPFGLSLSKPIPAPHEASSTDDQRLARLLQQLAAVWHDYRSAAWRTPLVQSILHRRFAQADYVRWMEHWIPQVREGSRWMREAIASMRSPYASLGALVETHASEEQFDFKILFDDYRSAGGAADSIDALRRNAGGEALNAFLHAKAATESPVGLLGAIYIIEGTGQRIIPALLPLLQSQLTLPPGAFRFLTYHGANDENHLARWLRAVSLVLAADPSGKTDDDIVATARRTAQLYLMQWEDAFTPSVAP
jgi:3-oxoacyl-[acyl-carrier-protein] synthase III